MLPQIIKPPGTSQGAASTPATILSLSKPPPPRAAALSFTCVSPFHTPGGRFSGISAASAQVLFLFREKPSKPLSLSFECGMDHLKHLMGIVSVFFFFNPHPHPQVGIILSKVWDGPEGDSQTSPGRKSFLLLFLGESQRNRPLPPRPRAWPDPSLSCTVATGRRESMKLAQTPKVKA